MPRALETPDPLARAIEPPQNETASERWAREQREAEARRISEQIDEQIRAERIAMKKHKPPMRLLLLGQSESGKSTTVKNFQLAFAYDAFLAERAAWRAVIHLNLVRSVNSIIDVLSSELAARGEAPVRSPTPGPGAELQHMGGALDNDVDTDENEDEQVESEDYSDFPLTSTHRELMLRLEPLRQVQRDLQRCLGAASTEETPSAAAAGAAPWNANSGGWRSREFSVTARSGWKAALGRVRAVGRKSVDSTVGRYERRPEVPPSDGRVPARPKTSIRRPSATGVQPLEPADERIEGAEIELAAEVIASCANDMSALWEDPAVRTVLSRKGIRPEEGPGFFLNDVARVAAQDYRPSDDDVVRARLRTMGVQEHHLKFEKGSEAGYEWLIYDVGGARSLRNAWYPYFDNINAIIFLAPISCFDEHLAEDRRVNRIQDSLLLWKAVCSTKLLAGVQLILFLNKCDLLSKKLERGVRVVDYVPTYGSKPNDVENVARYFRSQFKDISSRHSPRERVFYSFLTSVVDTKATRITVATVREGIQRNNLRSAVFI
ncbi:G-alpha-domain-containing protein [Trametes gibbosa]|nr:G-alpha-domain-containing protein [Trametes gibbosa]